MKNGKKETTVYINNKEAECQQLNKPQIVTNNNKSKLWKKILNILRRIELNSGLYFAKLLVWVGTAEVIIFLSSDLKTKLISSITYFVGIIFDMLILRKHQPDNGTTIIRAVEGFIALVVFGFTIASGIGLALCSFAKEPPKNYEPILNWVLPIFGILSTCVELINSIVEDD